MNFAPCFLNQDIGKEVAISKAKPDDVEAIHAVLTAAFRNMRGRGYNHHALEVAIISPQEIHDRILIDNHVFRSNTLLEHDPIQGCRDFFGRGLCLEYGESDQTPGIVIYHVQQPPTYGPPLPDSVGHPIGPEATGNRHGRQVGVPRMAGVLRHNATARARIIRRRFRFFCGFLLENPLNGGLADMDRGPGQLVRDLHLTQRRTKQLDPPDGVANEVWEPIHRRSCPKQRIVIGPTKPGPDRVIGDEETPGRFRLAPTSNRPKFQNRHPFGRQILRSSVRIDAFHAGSDKS